MTLTRAQQRELIRRLKVLTKDGPPGDPWRYLAEVEASVKEVCDGYTQALTDLDAAGQRERALLSVIQHAHDMFYGGSPTGRLEAFHALSRALPTPSAPPQRHGKGLEP